MRHIKITALLLIMAVHLFSCEDDFLSPTPISSISVDNFFTTEGELETGVINMYDGIQGFNDLLTSGDANYGIQLEFQLTEMRSDNTRTKSSEGESAQFESYSVEPTNGVVANYYSSYFNIIFRAHVVLENLGVASEATAAKFEGEAKFVRAYAYFNLVRLFGEVPMPTAVVLPTDKTTSFTRRSTADIYDLIVSDLTTAINNLDNTYRTRASKAAAQALLAKVYLTQGNYSAAQTLCESIMSAGGYSLQDNFQDIFYNERNDEIIFSIGFEAEGVDSQNFSAEWLNAVGRSSGLNYVTADARAAFSAFGGTMRSDYSVRVDVTQPTQFQVVKYLPNGDENLGIAATSSNPQAAGNDWIVIRYADVLLMHVEAILAGGVSTSNAGALTSFQAVRDRAGLTDLVTAISKQELMDERRVELAFENHRFFDLIRFGEAINVLGAFASANGNTFSGTDLLLPIPEREIGLSGGLLTQNPGYN